METQNPRKLCVISRCEMAIALGEKNTLFMMARAPDLGLMTSN
jgi:hypothetical protein